METFFAKYVCCFSLQHEQGEKRCDKCGLLWEQPFKFCPKCGCNLVVTGEGRMLNVKRFDARLDEMDSMFSKKQYERKKSALREKMSIFFHNMGVSIATAAPRDVRRFLVSREASGKTVKHEVKCPLLGTDKITCACPVGMALGTVKSLVGQMRAIFTQEGRGEFWDAPKGEGNPAASAEVKKHIECIGEEMARGHITPKQAKPLFMNKLECIVQFLNDELAIQDIDPRERFVCLRDRAFFLVQFFTGGRCGDLAMILIQDIKSLPGKAGVVIRQTMGKTMKGENSQNVFLIRGEDSDTCPVKCLEAYVDGARDMGVSLDTGYVFRPVTGQGFVLESPVPYQEVYDHLKRYLKKLDLWEGETPHGVRGGAAITLLLSGAATADVMLHGGWKTSEMAKRYSRANDFMQRSQVANDLSIAASGQPYGRDTKVEGVADRFKGCDYSSLPLAF